MSELVTILGATGSIGRSALDVLRRHDERFQVYGLSAHHQTKELASLANQCGAQVVSVRSGQVQAFQNSTHIDGAAITVLEGSEGLVRLAGSTTADVVITAIVGSIGLMPTLAAIRAGKKVLLANKEPLVMMGPEIIQEASNSGATIMPLDSEHNAVLQCLDIGQTSNDSKGIKSDTPKSVVKIILTASGGPFIDSSISDLSRVTPAQAANHPNWSMGKKISIDSATMMNKGLELIEACALFSVDPNLIEIVVHPQSIVHSLVEYADGSVIAQMANPDMRIPIATALGHPERIASGASRLRIGEIGSLDFREPDENRFPCLRLARQAAEVGGTAPTILNAANEIAVELFCKELIQFNEISKYVDKTLEHVTVDRTRDFETVTQADVEARRYTKQLIRSSTISI
ncbi:MAG: 1-deoxy-D-xylulose-5-phosphate reductoisomerase [Acidiferrobacteraceae bacterium]|nr:1-deoxy-D-xylulose-5-phosphate reductoisomerase [Acidiferrobacteraceae bacterium]